MEAKMARSVLRFLAVVLLTLVPASGRADGTAPVQGHVQTRDHGVAPDGGMVPIAVTATGVVRVTSSDFSTSTPLPVSPCSWKRDATLPCLTAAALTGGDGGTVTLVTNRQYLLISEMGSDNVRACNSTACTSYAAAASCQQINDGWAQWYPGPSAPDGGANPTFTFCAKTTAAPTVTFCPYTWVCL